MIRKNTWGLLVGGIALSSVVAFRPALPDPQRLLQQVQRFYAEAQPEVSYLHLNQDAYAAGETLWFKAYVVGAATHQLDTLSRVLYVDVVTPRRTVAFRRTLRLNRGLAEGDIVLPDTLPTGIYTIRAYTNWMRNWPEGLFFTRQVPVWQAVPPAAEPGAAAAPGLPARTSAARTTATKPDVQFFPEGGEYVQGAAAVVGVKAVAATGRGMSLRGTVLDEQNQPVVEFSTPALGMNSFTFTPQSGHQYHARVALPDGTTASYPLPAAQASGWLLTVRDMGPHFALYVRRPGATGAEALQVVAHVRGTPVYAGAGAIAPGETFAATIPKDRLPAGLVHITLLDEQNVARAERLVFAPAPATPAAELRADKPAYGLRQPVSVEVAVHDAQGQPLAAEVSVAVAAENGLPTEGQQLTTVQAHLLLTSELRGYVENPAGYFRDDTPATRRALDDLLLTQGWSRFVWQQVLAPEPVASTFGFPLERSLLLGGQLVRANGKPMPNGQLTLLQQGTTSVSQFTTNEQGYFLLNGFDGADTVRTVLQARTPKGGDKVTLRLWDRWPVPGADLPVQPPLTAPAQIQPQLTTYGQQSRRQQVLERHFRPDTTSGIVLRNVTVRGQRPVPEHDVRALHSSATYVVRTKDVPGAASYSNIFDVIRGKIPSLQISGSGMRYDVQYRGQVSLTMSPVPLMLLDGVPTDITTLLTIPVQDIDRVEMLSGNQTIVYGGGARTGALAVFTKRTGGPVNPVASPGVAARRLPAYYRAREFYAPRYETPAPAQRPDPRLTTLYWQPTLHIPASGQARFTFYTADAAGAFLARLEGVAANGEPVTAQARLVVEANR
ncbi:TonB-dependent receptor plug domain-containing protein [Hymenobacter pini]|uniref:TonB-dependent receptor plug domain-containing protein n=1 Tax=Hymenobacter pini TaxID=2880879 RepID=UPI001CF40CD1|nr:TonB-dependent receptor plug domain-containing protein [Hymenobacter pini]MCA8832018.1 TonB-dependent receptor plug domain-containing protein [Hymenobacter pini]